MAAVDASTSAGGAGTWSHTTGTGAKVLIVTCYAINDTVSGVTYAGNAMTLGAKTSFPGAGRQGAYIYYQFNPTVGANNVVVTGGTGIGSVSYTGFVTSGLDSTGTANNQDTSSTSITFSTTVVATSWLFGVQADGAGGETAGAGTIIRQSDANGLTMVDSNGSVAAGSRSLVVNYGSTAANAGVCISIAVSGGFTPKVTIL